MTLSRSFAGRRGWTTLASLTAVLGALVVVQLPVANADAPPAPAAVPSVLVLERTTPRPVGYPAPAPKPVAVQPVVRKAVAKPAAAKPAAAAIRRAVPAVRRAAAQPAASGLCSGAGWEQRRGAAALSSLRAGDARTGFRVAFKPARSGYMGMTYLNERRIDMYVRSCAKQSTELLRHVMAHELGHAWDTTRMSDAQRAAYKQARGIPAGTPWYGCSSCTDFATPAGDFAEVYAQWARGASTNRSQIAGDASRAQLASLAQRFFGA